jgi:nitroimidazol reductase NimA-like FMN-containing flavoprotein (pyridoxamine 5'-phosphate oxidase superfamily)
MNSRNLSLKELAYQFMNDNRMAALATSNRRGVPHVAPVFCIARKDLSLFFSSSVEGRKFNNLTDRPTVALSFSDEDSLSTVMLTGTAERINNLNTESEIMHELNMLRHNDPHWPIPSMKLFERGTTNEVAIMKVTPFEMTYANFENIRTELRQPYFQKII